MHARNKVEEGSEPWESQGGGDGALEPIICRALAFLHSQLGVAWRWFSPARTGAALGHTESASNGRVYP